jgi:hypothetical protein
VGTPITITVRVRLHPRMMERMTAGAEITTPHARQRDTRNRRLVSDRVFASKRLSRYSYAV